MKLRLSLSERIEVIQEFERCGQNAAKTARVFSAKHSYRTPLHQATVTSLVRKFQWTGSVQDSKRTGRPRTATSSAQKHNVLSALQSDSETSVRRLGRACSISKSSAYSILKELRFRPFRERHLQLLKPVDYNQRLQFCAWFLEHGDIHNTLFSDEAVFYLNGTVCRLHHWARENPRIFRACCTQDKRKVIVWAGICGNRIVGPYFFDTNVTGKYIYH